MKDKWCDLCAAKGLKKKLQHCQVNFDEGLVLCENTMCVYPFGSADVNSLLVKRLSETNETKERKESKRLNIKEKTVKTQVHPSPNNALTTQLYWCNSDSLCWLDSVLTVLVNNKCLLLCLAKLQGKESVLNKLCSQFNDAQCFGSMQEGRVLLNEARNNVFEFLKSKMKCEMGVNDCPLTALNLLVKENVYICEKFMLEYCWRFTCAVCGHVQVNRLKKLVASFPNTTAEFAMPSGYFLRPCYKCKAPGQRCTLMFQQMPPCVMVHFVEGVRNKEILKSQFNCHGKDYQLCQIIQYKRNPDHFVSWVRNTNGTHWAVVDDMKDEVSRWKKAMPSLPVNEIHIAIWERTSLYHKDSEATTKTVIHTRKQLHVSHRNTDIAYIPPLTTRQLKDLSSSHGISVACNDSPALNGNSSTWKIPKESCVGKSVLKSGNLTNKASNFHKGYVGEKRKDVGNFQPYIPRKKRSTSGDEEPALEDCSADDTMQTKSVCSLESKTFLPWQDAVSVDNNTETNKKQCDNQSDSGYSSPGSNSSCLSMTMPSSVNEESNLNEFLESLDSLDLPNRVTSSSSSKPAIGSVDYGASTSTGDIDDILGEIFEGGFQKDIPCRTLYKGGSSGTLCGDDDTQWLGSATNVDDFLLDLPQ